MRATFPRIQRAPMPPFYRRCRLGAGLPKSRVTDFIMGNTRRVIYVIIAQLP